MTDIDTATGLPALPEGYFWRVQHHREYADTVYGRVRINNDRERLQVVLIHRYEKTRTGTTTHRNWLGRYVHKPYTDIDVIEDALFTEDTLGTNKIAVQNAANRIVKLWEKAKERDALIGDYPPKSLEN